MTKLPIGVVGLTSAIVLFAASGGIAFAASASEFGTYLRPFTPDSPWNVKPEGVTFKTFVIPTDAYYPTVSGGAYSTGMFRASPADGPMVVYGRIHSDGTNPGIWDPDSEIRRPSVTIPNWPADTAGATGTDGHAEIVDEARGVIHSFWQLKKDTSGVWRAEQYAWTPLKGRGWGDGGHYMQGARAAGVATSGGLIRKHEVDDGKLYFEHALAIVLAHSALSPVSPGYMFPATNADGSYNQNFGQILEGALVMLPPSFDTSQIDNLQLRKVAETLKVYGARVVDRNTGTPFMIPVEIGSTFNLYKNGWDTAIANDLQLIRASLREVASVSRWISGTGEVLSEGIPSNVNLLSMRGPYTRTGGSAPIGEFDTLSQSVIFKSGIVGSRVVQQNKTGTAFHVNRVKWAQPKAGEKMKITAYGSGGAEMRLTLGYTSGGVWKEFSTQTLGAGDSEVFYYPASGSLVGVVVYSGDQGGTSSIGAKLLRADDSDDVGYYPGSGSPSPSPSPTPTPTTTSSPSPTPTVTASPAPSPSPSPTVTSSPSPTPTVTASPSPSPSPSPTVTSSPSPTPSPSPVTYPLGTYHRPFSADSPWNVKPQGVTLKTFNIPADTYYPRVSGGSQSAEIFRASSTDKSAQVFGLTTEGILNVDAQVRQASITVPAFPSSVVPAPDAHTNIVDEARGMVHSFYKLSKDSGGAWRADQYGWSPLKDKGFGNGGHMIQGARMSGVSPAGGLIRKHEIADGKKYFEHALAISLSNASLVQTAPGYAFPATAASGNSQNWGQIPIGALLMLPSTFDTALIKNPYLKKVAETLKVYGARVVDRSTGYPYVIHVENGSGYSIHKGDPDGWDEAAAAELHVIRKALREVASASKWVNGAGQTLSALNANLNLLSLRGPYTRVSGTAPMGEFWTTYQQVVFNGGISGKRVVQENRGSNSIGGVKWLAPKAGEKMKITANGAGRAKVKLVISYVVNGVTKSFGTRELNPGDSEVFLFPSATFTTKLVAISGDQGGTSSIGAALIRASSTEAVGYYPK